MYHPGRRKVKNQDWKHSPPGHSALIPRIGYCEDCHGMRAASCTAHKTRSLEALERDTHSETSYQWPGGIHDGQYVLRYLLLTRTRRSVVHGSARQVWPTQCSMRLLLLAVLLRLFKVVSCREQIDTSNRLEVDPRVAHVRSPPF
jgi:hypothetical protein